MMIFSPLMVENDLHTHSPQPFNIYFLLLSWLGRVYIGCCFQVYSPALTRYSQEWGGGLIYFHWIFTGVGWGYLSALTKYWLQEQVGFLLNLIL